MYSLLYSNLFYTNTNILGNLYKFNFLYALIFILHLSQKISFPLSKISSLKNDFNESNKLRLFLISNFKAKKDVIFI